MVTHRWDPIRDLLALQERMNRLFEESLARRPDADSPSGWVPLADVYETAEAFVAVVELPGVDEADLGVQVQEDHLVVRGERRLSGVRPESFHRMERSYGSFSRTFVLGEEVDVDRVDARLSDGVLRVDLPKARPRPALRVRAERRE